MHFVNEPFPSKQAQRREIFQPVTDHPIVVADAAWLMIERAEPLGDELASAQYPNRGTSPADREFALHRLAGLAGQLNVERCRT